MQSAIRVFIGSGPRFEEPTEALIASIYAHTNPREVDITVMRAWDETQLDQKWSNWIGQPTEANFGRVRGNWVTPFSLFRYAIPSMCNNQGFAIYLDCDMISMADIRELWEHRKTGKWCIAPNRDGDCVIVMDCAATPAIPFLSLKNGHLGDKRKLRTLVTPFLSRTIPEEWNHTDRYKPGSTKLVHYTSMKTQPWRPYPEVINYEPHPDPGAVKLYEEWCDFARLAKR